MVNSHVNGFGQHIENESQKTDKNGKRVTSLEALLGIMKPLILPPDLSDTEPLIVDNTPVTSHSK